jgi:hypothetical protein
VKFDPDMFILVVLGEPLFGLRVMVEGSRLKAAVTFRLIAPDAWPTVTGHVGLEPEQSPPQPPNEDPLDQVAVRVTKVSLWVSLLVYAFEQLSSELEEQSIFWSLLVTLP